MVGDAPPLLQEGDHHLLVGLCSVHAAELGVVPAVEVREHRVGGVDPQDGVRRSDLRGLSILNIVRGGSGILLFSVLFRRAACQQGQEQRGGAQEREGTFSPDHFVVFSPLLHMYFISLRRSRQGIVYWEGVCLSRPEVSRTEN